MMRVLSIAALLVGLAAGCGPSVDVGAVTIGSHDFKPAGAMLWISITDAGATTLGSLPTK